MNCDDPYEGMFFHIQSFVIVLNAFEFLVFLSFPVSPFPSCQVWEKKSNVVCILLCPNGLPINYCLICFRKVDNKVNECLFHSFGGQLNEKWLNTNFHCWNFLKCDDFAHSTTQKITFFPNIFFRKWTTKLSNFSLRQNNNLVFSH